MGTTPSPFANSCTFFEVDVTLRRSPGKKLGLAVGTTEDGTLIVAEIDADSPALSREERFAAYGPQAVNDAWMTFVVPKAVSRNRVQIVGLKGRPELNGQEGTCSELVEAKGRYPVKLEGGEAVLIKMVNLLAIGDRA